MKSQTDKQDSSRLIPLKSALNPKLSRIRLLQITAEAIAKNNWWQMFLITVGSASSIIYPHVPLVGFAAVAGNTLTRKKAIITVTSIWCANQLYGFTIRQYPRTLESLIWGLVMGLGMLAVICLVTLKPKFSRRSFWGYSIWLVIYSDCYYEPQDKILGQKTSNLPRLEVILEPGDVLFNAPWWWHSVENLDDLTVGCAVRQLNFKADFHNNFLFTMFSYQPLLHLWKSLFNIKRKLTKEQRIFRDIMLSELERKIIEGRLGVEESSEKHS